ncbi:unnamed protein product [Fraxinus pennsylvanica]|uniref:protein disulfide-isomerase n=1 Tax=Fraxinus pennsylvanica TaxID=56036 RepID=A0AAD1Z7E0_9LAMI|nr:unnamed protein product [Fraxinus pennsylvanica]
MSRSWICIAFGTLALFLFASAFADNVVVLTEDNFEKEVGQDRGALVEFYAPWCGHCKKLAPEYEKLGESFKKAKSVLIGKNNKAGEDYDGGRDLDEFVSFINEKCGTSRDAKGQFTNKAGIVEALDSLVKEFVSASSEEKKAVFSRLEAEAEKLKGSNARYGKLYVKAAKSCLERGAEYAKNEIQRLERMLAKSIAPAKADEFTLKKNILSTFASDQSMIGRMRVSSMKRLDNLITSTVALLAKTLIVCIWLIFVNVDFPIPYWTRVRNVSPGLGRERTGDLHFRPFL